MELILYGAHGDLIAQLEKAEQFIHSRVKFTPQVQCIKLCPDEILADGHSTKMHHFPPGTKQVTQLQN